MRNRPPRALNARAPMAKSTAASDQKSPLRAGRAAARLVSMQASWIAGVEVQPGALRAICRLLIGPRVAQEERVEPAVVQGGRTGRWSVARGVQDWCSTGQLGRTCSWETSGIRSPRARARLTRLRISWKVAPRPVRATRSSCLLASPAAAAAAPTEARPRVAGARGTAAEIRREKQTAWEASMTAPNVAPACSERSPAKRAARSSARCAAHTRVYGWHMCVWTQHA